MPAAVRKDVKKHLDDAGMKLINCYLSELPNKEVKFWRMRASQN